MLTDFCGKELRLNDPVVIALDKEKLAAARVEEIGNDYVFLKVYSEGETFQSRIIVPKLSLVKI